MSQISEILKCILNIIGFINWMWFKILKFYIFCRFSFVMDQIKKLTEPGRQFAKDSIRLVKRCTKPDRKGNLTLLILLTIVKYCSLILIIYIFINYRISKDRNCHCNRFLYNGFHRILRQANSYPN